MKLFKRKNDVKKASYLCYNKNRSEESMKYKAKIALIYDFDKTLCTTDMQNYSFIPALNIKPQEFWEQCNEFSKKEHMESLLVYMYLMIKYSKEKNLPINREAFVNMGKNIQFFPGVKEWFNNINEYGKSLNVDIEHYVISSGNKEIIEGSDVFKYFKEVFACEFLYENDVAIWPKNVINYTTKTQYLFRINKGVFDIADNDKVNSFVPESERMIPFRNMIYIADGLTDVPCMKLVREKGGFSIAVYSKKKLTASQLFADNRVDYIAAADYTENSTLTKIVKMIIQHIQIKDDLVRLHNKQAKDIIN